MGLPLAFVLFFGVCAAFYVISTRLIIPHVRPEKQALTCGSITQRFFLLQAFYEMQERLPFLYKREEWKPFYERIKVVLGEIQAAARSCSQEGMQDDRVSMKRLSEAIDRHLVSYLQSQRILAELLHESLPASGQSWASTLTRARANLENESESSDNESDSSDNESDSSDIKSASLFQHEIPVEKLPEALEDMRKLVDLILHGLDEIDFSISDGATRGETDLTFNQVPPDHITVFYATDRQMTEDGEYSGKRSKRNALHFGRMAVGIPSRGKGLKIPGPQKHEEADPHLHIVILSMNTELRDDEHAFVENLDKALHPKAEGNQECMTNALLLYIHGFNVSHKNAIKTAARLKRDINFKGQVIVYSWSSYGALTLPAYRRDEENIAKTVDCLKIFIETITNRIPGNPDVHVVAHSMGNRGLITALTDKHFTPSTMKNIVFVAADVERKDFTEIVRTVKMGGGRSDHQQHNGGEKLSARTPLLTVYSSMTDQALFVSKYINWSKGRLGDTRSFLVTETQEKGSDQVDVTGSKVTKAWLHHSYYGKIPAVLEDIEDLVKYKLNAEERCQRHPRIEPVTSHGKKFFAFDKSVWLEEQRCF